MPQIDGPPTYRRRSANYTVTDRDAVTKLRRAEQRVEASRRDVERARARCDEAKEAARKTRARAAAGAPMEGREAPVGPEMADDIYVAPDGTTNLWRYQPPVHDYPDYYEQVRVEPSRRNPRVVRLVSPEGFKIRRTTNYRNYTHVTVTPRVWVGKPAAGSRPVREVHDAVVLEGTVDSGD